MNIQRYTAADLNTLMDKITRNSIGMDEYLIVYSIFMKLQKTIHLTT